MGLVPLFLAGFVFVPVAASAGKAGDTLRLQVPAGTQLVKTLNVKHELQVLSMGMTRDGAYIPDTTGGWVTTEQTTRVLDRYEEVADGRPTRLLRTFQEATNRGRLDASRDTKTKASEQNVSDSPFVQKSKEGILERNVRFTWVPSEQGWGRHFEVNDCEESYLMDLDADMDYLALVPAGPVEIGATWDLAPERIRSVLAPGGNVLLTPRSGALFGRAMELGLGGDYADFLSSQPSVEIATCTYKGVREAHSRRMAVVEVRLKLSELADRTELYYTARSKEEKREAGTLLSATVSYTLDGSGELLWDLEAQHAASFKFSGQETFALEVNKEVSIGGNKPMVVGQRSQFGGHVSLEFGAAAPAAPPSAAPSGEAPPGEAPPGEVPKEGAAGG